jgi:uncharacterized protein (TIGR02598 family)
MQISRRARTARATIPRSEGFTLIETTLAVTMLALFIAMLMVMNSNVMGLLRNSKDNVAASQALQERIEQMRIANWLQITDADYLATTLLAEQNDSAATLQGAVEKITVTAYPPKTGSAAVKASRSNGTASVGNRNVDLKEERMVRVDLELTWQGFPKNRPRARATTAIIAKGGITK